MAEKYTITTAMETGKSDPTYGTEYHIKFAENEGTFKLWYKVPPKEGQVQEGTIDDWKFTKAKKEYNGGTDAAQKKWTPMKKDNSDGQRQGMCFNNAANYVSAHSDEIAPPEIWAKTVWTYARSLYALGDITLEPEAAVEVPMKDAPKNVQEVFGVTK